jgi:actin-related protein
MFEAFGFAALHMVENPAVNIIRTRDVRTGLVVDLGEGHFSMTPVIEGRLFTHSKKSLHFGGAHLTQHLIELLQPQISFTTSYERLIIAPMIKSGTENVYTLPDGKKISVKDEREKLVECIFDTSLYNAIDFFNS